MFDIARRPYFGEYTGLEISDCNTGGNTILTALGMLDVSSVENLDAATG